jgi:hypothetical protein
VFGGLRTKLVRGTITVALPAAMNASQAQQATIM